MPRGTPDGRIVDTLLAGQVTDLGAVYSMLWGFSPIDGQGRVMYFDTFNNGLNGWVVANSGSGSVLPVLASPANYVFSPPNCVNLNAGVTSNSMSYIYRELFAGKTTRLGIEIGFQLTSGMQPRISIDYNPISGSPFFGVMAFSQSGGFWWVRTPGAVATSFYTPGAVVGAMMTQIKIVMDFSTGKYVRAFVGDQDFDLSAYSMDTSSSSYNGLAIAQAANISKGAGAGILQLGYVLVTKDEP